MAVPNIFGTATAAIPLSQLDQNFATAITIGNTAVYLGNTTTSLGNVTLTNVTITSGTSNITTNVATVTGTLPEANGGTGTTTGYYGFKNRIINGSMVIDQRNAGASFTVGNLGYGIDRWLTQAVTASGTGQQVTGSTGNNKALRITGASGNTAIQVSQRIESVNIYDCASQSVTVSFTLSGSASGSVSVRFLYPTATDNYTSTTEPVAGTTVNFTTTATQYSVTRTLDSNANKGVWVLLDFGAVGASVTRTIEFFQLEKGSTATSFDYRPYGTELALCQRYCPAWSVSVLSGNFPFSGQAYGTTSAVFIGPYPVQPRVAATGLTTSGTFTATTASYGVATNGTVAIYGTGTTLYNFGINFTGTSGLVVGNSTNLVASSTLPATIIATGCEL